jgi:hypothetical protein
VALTSLRAWLVRAWWAIFENLIYLAFALGVVALIGTLGLAAGIYGPTSVDVPQMVGWPFPALEPLPQRVGPLEIVLNYSAHVSLDHPTRWQVLLIHMPSVVTALLTTVIAFLLWQVARTLRSGDPFVPSNARRIFTMAGCVAGYSLIAEPLRTWAVVTTVRGTPAERMIDTAWPFTWAPLGFALLLAALGAIFRRGTRLRADVEGLV